MRKDKISTIRLLSLSYSELQKVRVYSMTKMDYYEFMEWGTPEEGDGDTEGYLIEYINGGEPNVEGFNGPIDWISEGEFEKHYGLDYSLEDNLYVELEQLREKIERVTDRLKSCDPVKDQDDPYYKLTMQQLCYMKLYEDALRERLKLVTDDKAERKIYGDVKLYKTREVIAVQWTGKNRSEVWRFLRVVRDKSRCTLRYYIQSNNDSVLELSPIGCSPAHPITVHASQFVVYDELSNQVMVMSKEKFSTAYEETNINN